MKKVNLKELEKKYKNKKFSPSDLMDIRTELVKKYGHKIVNWKPNELTKEERMAQIEYKTSSSMLHSVIPGPFVVMDWLVETTAGRLVTYIGSGTLILILTLTISSEDFWFFLICIVGSLFMYIKALILIFRIVFKKIKQYWKETEP